MFEVLKRIRVWFFRQKYRFDLGAGFMSIINFALLVLATRSKLPMLDGIPTVLIVIGAVVLLWAFGYFMDRFVKTVQQIDRENASRSLTWLEHKEQTDRIEELLKQIKKGSGDEKA